MEVSPEEIEARINMESDAWSVFLCISRHNRAGKPVEDTDVYIGRSNSLPPRRTDPYSVGMIVDGFLSFGEAKIICDWARKSRSGARQLAQALLALCHQVDVYRPMVDINVLLGLKNVPYRVIMDKGIVHLSRSPSR
jgi:hypothetical protein